MVFISLTYWNSDSSVKDWMKIELKFWKYCTSFRWLCICSFFFRFRIDHLEIGIYKDSKFFTWTPPERWTFYDKRMQKWSSQKTLITWIWYTSEHLPTSFEGIQLLIYFWMPAYDCDNLGHHFQGSLIYIFMASLKNEGHIALHLSVSLSVYQLMAHTLCNW